MGEGPDRECFYEPSLLWERPLKRVGGGVLKTRGPQKSKARGIIAMWLIRRCKGMILAGPTETFRTEGVSNIDLVVYVVHMYSVVIAVIILENFLIVS